MEEFSKKLVDQWKDIIESIDIEGYKRKVDSINLFRMDKWYTGYPDIIFCYKVNFNFVLNEYQDVDRSNKKSKSDIRVEAWHRELDSIFEGVFRDGSGQLPNSKVDYKQNQGYRFIVQFYPAGFLIEKTQSQLDRLGLG